MLLQLKTGDYLTIGKDAVVQLKQISGGRCKLMIEPPLILRRMKRSMPRNDTVSNG